MACTVEVEGGFCDLCGLLPTKVASFPLNSSDLLAKGAKRPHGQAHELLREVLREA